MKSKGFGAALCICHSHICIKNRRKSGLFSIQFSCTTTNTTYLDNLRIHVKRMGGRKQVNRRQSFNTMLRFLVSADLLGSSLRLLWSPSNSFPNTKPSIFTEMIHYPQAGIRSTRRKTVARALAKRRMLPASLW